MMMVEKDERMEGAKKLNVERGCAKVTDSAQRGVQESTECNSASGLHRGRNARTVHTAASGGELRLSAIFAKPFLCRRVIA